MIKKDTFWATEHSIYDSSTPSVFNLTFNKVVSLVFWCELEYWFIGLSFDPCWLYPEEKHCYAQSTSHFLVITIGI